MDVKAFPALIVGVVVALVLAGAVLPVFAETTSATDTFTNEGYYRMSIPTEEYVITYNPSVDGKSVIGINGEKYDLINDIPAYGSRSIAFAENYILRVFNDGGSGVFSIQLWNNAFVIGVSSGTFTGTLTVTIDNGVLTWHNSTTDATTTYNYTGDMVAIDPKGDMILKRSDNKSYVLPDSSIIYGGGISLLKDTTYSGIYIEGTIEDYDVTVLNTNATVSNKNEVYTEVDNYKDLVLFEKFTFDTTYSGNTTSQTYSYVVVPYEVTAEKAIHPDGPLTVILNVLPLLAIAGLVTGAVVWFINRKG